MCRDTSRRGAARPAGVLRLAHGWCLALLACCFTHTTARAADPRLPPEVEAFLGAPKIAARGAMDLSPDGQYLVLTAEDPRKRAGVRQPEREFFSTSGVVHWMLGRDLYLVSTQGGETRPLAASTGSSWGGTWSPDGRRIAFYSDRDGALRLWIFDLGSNRARRVSDRILRIFRDWELPQWSRDGREILVKALPEGLRLEDSARSRQQPRAAEPGSSSVRWFTSPRAPQTSTAPRVNDMSLGDLIWLDSTTGAARTLATGVASTGYRLSPDGRHLALVRDQPEKIRTSPVSIKRLIVVDRSTGEQIFSVPGLHLDYEMGFSWSPDSRWLAILDTGFGTVPSGPEPKRILLVEPASRSIVTADPLPEALAQQIESRALMIPSWGEDAVWLVGPRQLYRLDLAGAFHPVAGGPDDRWMFEATSQSGRLFRDPTGAAWIFTAEPTTGDWGFDRVDLSSGELLDHHGGPRGGTRHNFLNSLATESGKLLFLSGSSDHPVDVWAATGSDPRASQLSELHPRLPPMEPARVVTWPKSDGTGRGVLIPPPSPKPAAGFPLLTWVYSDSPWSEQVHSYALIGSGPLDLQMLASRGYLVFCPDTVLEEGRPRASMSEQVLAGVDHLINSGWADPERLGVLGVSWGGYNTLSLITSSKRFAAALSAYGISNLVSGYGLMIGSDGSDDVDYYERREGRIGGTLWDYRERYVENSPIFFLDRVETPLLLVHGTLDHPEQSDQVFVGLRRLGKTVAYARYEGEHHGAHHWTWSNQIDLTRRTLDWFGQHLAVPLDPGQGSSAGAGRDRAGDHSR